MDKKDKTSLPDDPFEQDDWGPDETTAAPLKMPPPVEGKFPFLKPENLRTAFGRDMELIGVAENTEFSDCVVHVRLNNTNYRIGMKFYAEEYKALLRAYGDDAANWHGPLAYKVMAYKGNPNGFVAIRPLVARKAAQQ
jgi:hypothetical protein